MTFANTLLRVEIPGLGSSLGQNPVLGASVDDADRLTTNELCSALLHKLGNGTRDGGFEISPRRRRVRK